MSNELQELFGTIADEEKAAASAYIRGRIDAMTAQDDGPMRARIFAATTMIAGAELFVKLDSAAVVAKQMRSLADRIEGGANPLTDVRKCNTITLQAQARCAGLIYRYADAMRRLTPDLAAMRSSDGSNP